MNVYKWILVAWFVVAALLTVANIGKERTPTTPGVAVGTLLAGAGLITLVVLS